MTSTTKCECPAPHVSRVELSPIHILGKGIVWLAARPGGVYLTGHGWHFDSEQAAKEYAFGADQ